MNARSLTFAKKADIKPGELALFEVAGRRIAVANADGRFFAIDDTCTHEQCSERFHGNRRDTAEALKISAVTLWRKMKQYGLSGTP